MENLKLSLPILCNGVGRCYKTLTFKSFFFKSYIYNEYNNCHRLLNTYYMHYMAKSSYYLRKRVS